MMRLIYIWMALCACGQPLADQNTEVNQVMKDSSDTMNMDQEQIPVALLSGKFSPESHPDFVKIPATYANREGMYVRKEVWEAFLAMYEAAQKDGFTLKILSATRNFDQQKAIWERKWKERAAERQGQLNRKDSMDIALDILKYSSMPGTSRHHWGTDIDLNSLQVAYFESGEGKQLYQWLRENAPRFGFCQPYSNKDSGRTGYEEEKWHWSFVPIATTYTKSYSDQVTYENICCFEGDTMAGQLEVIKYFVKGIDDSCMPGGY
jgi:zinc D-Ala-D-Ala carboxypeptidase